MTPYPALAVLRRLSQAAHIPCPEIQPAVIDHLTDAGLAEFVPIPHRPGMRRAFAIALAITDAGRSVVGVRA